MSDALARTPRTKLGEVPRKSAIESDLYSPVRRDILAEDVTQERIFLEYRATADDLEFLVGQAGLFEIGGHGLGSFLGQLLVVVRVTGPVGLTEYADLQARVALKAFRRGL